jgi:hypothetical protein
MKEYHDAGFEGWRPKDLAGFSQFHVPADYVRGMVDAGIIDKKEILKAYVEGVGVDDVKAVFRNGD